AIIAGGARDRGDSRGGGDVGEVPRAVVQQKPRVGPAGDIKIQVTVVVDVRELGDLKRRGGDGDAAQPGGNGDVAEVAGAVVEEEMAFDADAQDEIREAVAVHVAEREAAGARRRHAAGRRLIAEVPRPVPHVELAGPVVGDE